MGTLISRIEKEFVLNTVSDKDILIRIQGHKSEAVCEVMQIDDDYLILGIRETKSRSSVKDDFTVGSRVCAYFSYFGHVMTFSATIRAIDRDEIRVDFPETLYKNLSRKYTRVQAPKHATVSFTVQETKVELDFPKSEEYEPVDLPSVADDFDTTNLEKLIESFREKVKWKASKNTIVMFRDRKPAGFEELIIARTGKIFYIPNTAGRFPENDYQLGGRIITRAMLLNAPGESEDAGEVLDRLPSLLAAKRANGIRAEIYCPILFRQYTIGYIYLAQDEGADGVFDHDLLEMVHQYAKVIAYSLKTNGYFEGVLPDESNYDGEMIDISAAGLLFCNQSDQLRETLALYTDLDLMLNFGNRIIRVVGRLMRKYKMNGTSFYGLQFMEMQPEDFRFLFEYIYGRSLRAEDEELWEGGSEPPRLEF